MKRSSTSLRGLEIALKLVVIVAIISALGSCSTDDETGNGTLSIRMTDAPFPSDLVAEANVTINKVEARLEARQKGETKGSPFIVLSEEEVTFNLLDLTNGVTASLVDVEVPAGTYDLVRLYVSEASVVLSDSTSYEMKVPSGAESGLKLFIDPAIEVAGGLSAELLLDFDVSRSFVAKGDLNSPAGISGFNFTPVIKVANLSTSGRLEGTVTDTLANPLNGVTVAVYAADTLNTTTFSGENGGYAVIGLVAGTYDLVVEYEGYNSQTLEGVEVVAGNSTSREIELIAEEE